jgi:O-antigen/teichoic acid export membrane protein
VTTPTGSFQRDRRDIFRGSLFNIGGFLLRMCSRVPFLFIAGQLYGAARYGEYVLATAVIESAAVVGTFGFKLTLFRFLHDTRESAEDVVRHVLTLTLGLAIILATILWLCSEPLARLFNTPGAAPKIAFLAWFIPAIVLADILLAATWAKRVVHFDVVARSIVEPATTTTMSYIMFRLGYAEMGLPIAYAVAFSSAAIAAAISFARLYSWQTLFRTRLRASYLWELARQSASTSVHDVIGLLFGKIDIMAVGYFFDTTAVGRYGMAQQFLTVMEKVTLSFIPILLPVLTEALRMRDVVRARSQIFAVAGRIVMMQAPIVIVFLIAGPFLLGLIGPGFREAWGVLMVLSFGAWVNGVLGLSELALLSVRPRTNPQASAIRLLLYALVLFPFQTLWGPRGVAMANAIATLAANLVRAFVCRPALRAPEAT